MCMCMCVCMHGYIPRDLPIGHGCPKKGIVFWHSPSSPTPLEYNVERVLTFARPLAKSENDLLNIVFLGARGAQWLYVSSASACKKTIPFFGQGGWLYKTIKNIMTGDAFLLFYALRWKLRAVTCSNSRDCVLGHLLWKHEWHTVYIFLARWESMLQNIHAEQHLTKTLSELSVCPLNLQSRDVGVHNLIAQPLPFRSMSAGKSTPTPNHIHELKFWRLYLFLILNMNVVCLNASTRIKTAYHVRPLLKPSTQGERALPNGQQMGQWHSQCPWQAPRSNLAPSWEQTDLLRHCPKSYSLSKIDTVKKLQSLRNRHCNITVSQK